MMKRRTNNQLDADKLRFIDVISSTFFGHSSLQTQQVHKNLPLLCKSNTTQPVLYIISGLLVHVSTPDDGHSDAENTWS
jgi:hypothetical protein